MFVAERNVPIDHWDKKGTSRIDCNMSFRDVFLPLQAVRKIHTCLRIFEQPIEQKHFFKILNQKETRR